MFGGDSAPGQRSFGRPVSSVGADVDSVVEVVAVVVVLLPPVPCFWPQAAIAKAASAAIRNAVAALTAPEPICLRDSEYGPGVSKTFIFFPEGAYGPTNNCV